MGEQSLDLHTMVTGALTLYVVRQTPRPSGFQSPVFAIYLLPARLLSVSMSPRRSFVRRYRENDVRWKTGFVCSIPNGTVFCF